MKENAKIKIESMIEVAKRDFDFWKIDDVKALVDSQLREIETLEYIYNLIQKDDE